MYINEFLITCTASSESSVCLWDYNTRNLLKLFKSEGVITSRSLEIIGQDYILCSELEKPILHVWPLNSQECSGDKRLILPESATCLAVCPRNLYLVAGIKCKVYIWQLTSGKLLSVHQKNFQPITVIKFSSDGDYLLVAGEDGIVVVYNFTDLINLTNSFLTQTDIGQAEPLYIKNDHSMPITDLHVGSFGRKSRFATVSSDQTCKIYNLTDGEVLLTLVFNEILTAITSDAAFWNLFIGSNSGVIFQCNLRNPPRELYNHIEAKSTCTFEGQKGKVLCIAVNITNTILASGFENNVTCIWELKSRQILRQIETKGSVTNVTFILGYHNFFIEKLKPREILKKLERSLNVSDNKFSISQMQPDDINLKEMKFLAKENSLSHFIKQNIQLRCINKQLYNTALEISKKYNM